MENIKVSLSDDDGVVSMKADGKGVHLEFEVDINNASPDALYGAMSALVEALEKVSAAIMPAYQKPNSN
jgi:hypothetical protein